MRQGRQEGGKAKQTRQCDTNNYPMTSATMAIATCGSEREGEAGTVTDFALLGRGPPAQYEIVQNLLNYLVISKVYMIKSKTTFVQF